MLLAERHAGLRTRPHMSTSTLSYDRVTMTLLAERHKTFLTTTTTTTTTKHTHIQ